MPANTSQSVARLVKMQEPLPLGNRQLSQSRLSSEPRRQSSHPSSPGVKSGTRRLGSVSASVSDPSSRSSLRSTNSWTAPSRPQLVHGNSMMRPIDRPPPGDPLGRRKSTIHPEIQKKRSAYFEHEFAASNRDPDPVKSRVEKEAIVMAEIKTNVIIQDEFTFITDFSNHLSNRYQRPLSSIVVSVSHSRCLMFGGSFDSAYVLTIHALPSLLRPATNKRNAALIQRHVQETLGVKASRGYVRFVATPEETVASGGRTMAAEMEDLDKGASVAEALPSRKGSKSRKRLSVKSLGSLTSGPNHYLPEKSPTPPPDLTVDAGAIPTIPEVPPTPPDEDRLGELSHHKPGKQASRRRSLKFALFGKAT